MEQKNSDKSISCFIQKSFPERGLKVYFFLVLLLLFSTLIFPLKSYAVPAYDGFFELKQLSGFTLEARQHGDEWYNWVETRDGYGIYKNTTTGNWEYYMPSTNIAGANGRSPLIGVTSHAVVGEVDPSSLGIPKGLRPPRTSVIKPQLFDLKQNISSQKSLRAELGKGLKNTALSGTMHLLVIAVDYADATATYTADQIQPLLFGASNSVSDYYSKTSYSSVTITPAAESHGTLNDGFIGWLRLSGNHPNIGSPQIAENAILAADPYIDYSLYDTNGNGYIESTELSVMIMVAGYEASYSNDKPSIWAHAAGGYISVSVDGKIIYQYAEFGEKHGDHLATFGVMAHELGHLMFGLPDLYDTDTSNGDSSGVGYFDLMGTGSWGAASGAYAGSSPTQLSAWCKEYLSWGIVNTISSSQSASFPKSDGNSSSVFRMNTSDPNQYFLIENRQFTGYDIGFQGAIGASGHGGLVIYHIDSSKTSNADENDKMVDVEEANEGSAGYSMLDTKTFSADTNMFFFSGNNSSFTDTTTPGSKLKNGNSTNISVTDISAYGDAMTATVFRPPTAKTGSATDMTSDSATLNGTVNAYGMETTVWFEYGTNKGSYGNTSSTQTVSGTGDTTVSASINGLTSETTYYYRIVAQNSAGTVYGTENTFTLISVTPKIAAGYAQTLGLKSDGTVWAWGWNKYGQLGDDTDTDRTSPVQVSGLSGVTAIVGGWHHSLALKSDGTVWGWGDNWGGQLGDRTTTNRTTPVQANGIGGVTAIAGGGYHSLALKSDGTVWSWGYNAEGQLGNGTTTNSSTPVQVSTLSGVTAVAAGGFHSIALKSDGTVWAWGDNDRGQLGDGTTTDSSTSIQVSGLSGVIAVAAGGYHSLALKSDGTVWAWGYNNSGQLGDGTTTNRSTPIQIVGLDNVIAIAGGSPFSMALKSDGTVWTSGAYEWFTNDGQRGWYYYRTYAAQITEISGVSAIAAGHSHHVALKSNGSVWTWGYNYYGQLGDGTTTDNNIPTQVDINLGETTVPPMVDTGSASNITSNSATLNGTVNANGLNTTTWFEYGTTSGTFGSTSSTQTVSGWDDTTVSISISELSAGTTYYYRIAAQNSAGTAYGSEITFTTLTPPVTHTLTVASFNPNSGVSITVSPNDNNGLSNGTTQFTRSYNNNTAVTLTAPSTAEGNSFQKWQRNGVDLTTSQTANVMMNDDYTMTAVYVTSPTPIPTPTSTPKPTGNIAGQVTDSMTGAGINDATVTLDTGESTATGTVGGQDGVYVIQGVPIGLHDITVSALGFATSSQTVTVVEGDANSQTGENVFNFALTSAVTPTPTPTTTTGNIVGLVTDAVTGAGIGGATVLLNKSKSTTTNSNGSYVFSNIAVGDYTVTATKTGYKVASVTATVAAGQTTRVDIGLTPEVNPTPTPTSTPTPTCNAANLDAEPEPLKLKKEKGADETVTVTCDNGTPVAGTTVTATVIKGKKRVSVLPTSEITDTNGQATFTIKAKNKTGNAKVRFEADGLRDSVSVKVSK